MLIYPKQHAVVMREPAPHVQEILADPIQEQLDNLTRFGRAMKRMLRIKKGEEPPKEEDKTGGNDTKNEEWEDDLEEKVE